MLKALLKAHLLRKVFQMATKTPAYGRGVGGRAAYQTAPIQPKRGLLWRLLSR